MTIKRTVDEKGVNQLRATTLDIVEEAQELMAALAANKGSRDYKVAKYWWDRDGWDRDGRNLHVWSDGLDHKDSLSIAEAGGISDQTENCRAILEKLPQVMQTTQEQGFYWDVWGSAWDMGALLAGEPEVGLQFDTVEVKNPCVKIVVDMFYSGVVPAAKLTQRAAALTALLAALNSMGYAVELDLWLASRNGDSKKLEILIEVHNAGRVFDLARIAYWCGHPAAVRQLCYPVMDRGYYESSVGCFGNSLPDDARTAEKKKECKKEGWLYIESGYAGLVGDQYSTPEKAAKWVAEQVDNINKTHTMSKED